MNELSNMSPFMKMIIGVAIVGLLVNGILGGVSSMNSYVRYAPIHQLSNYVQTTVQSNDYIFYRLVSVANQGNRVIGDDVELDVAFRSLEPETPEVEIAPEQSHEEEVIQLTLAEIVKPALSLSAISSSGAFINGKYLAKGNSIDLNNVINLHDQGPLLSEFSSAKNGGLNKKIRVVRIHESSVTVSIDGHWVVLK